jgi:hypothetical protein
MITSSFRNAVLSAVTLAGLTALACAMLTGSAEAKMNSCALRQSYCNERCIMNNMKDPQIGNCIRRTCDHQYNNCMRDGGGASGGGGRVRDHRRR